MENSMTIFSYLDENGLNNDPNPLSYPFFQIHANSDGQSYGVIQPQTDSNSKLKLLSAVSEHG